MRSLFSIFQSLSTYLLAGMLTVACTRNDLLPTCDTGTTTIQLCIPQLKATTRVAGTPEEEAIHTLRVIITNPNFETYINRSFTPEEMNGSSLLIEHVPVGTVQMYVIANEGALGKDYSDFNVWKEDMQTINGKRKLIITDTGREHFPLRGSEFATKRTGLPMSWYDKELSVVPITSGTPQTIKVDLERCVAKLNIIMNNSLNEEIHITEMSFGAFLGDHLCVFREEYLDIPPGTQYAAVTYPQGEETLDIRIPANSNETLVCYIYPSYAWNSPTQPTPYTIGFKTPKGTYDSQPFVDKEHYAELNSIVRNTQVNIYATLSKPANVQLKFSVAPWTAYDSDVPPFN